MKSVIKFLILFLFFAAIGTIYVTSKSGPQDAGSSRIPGEDLPVLVQFTSESCVYCKEMEPILEEITEEYEGKAIIRIVDVNEHPDEARENSIRVVPTQVFFNAQGEGVNRHEGFMSKEEVLQVFREIGVE
jgi:thioredoxin 1